MEIACERRTVAMGRVSPGGSTGLQMQGRKVVVGARARIGVKSCPIDGSRTGSPNTTLNQWKIRERLASCAV